MNETRFYIGSDANGTFFTPKQVAVPTHGLLIPFAVFITIVLLFFSTVEEGSQAKNLFPDEEFSASNDAFSSFNEEFFSASNEAFSSFNEEFFFSDAKDGLGFFFWDTLSEDLQYLINHHTLLRNKDQGEAVMIIQKALHNLNYYPDNPDGIFGPATKNAVLNFQAANQLVVDGIVGPDTLRALKNKLNY